MKPITIFLLAASALAFISKDSKQLLGKHEERANTVAFNQSGELLASGSHDNKISVWDVKQKQLKHTFFAHSVGIADLVFTKDDKYLVSAGLDSEIRVWNTENWKREKALTAHSSQVLSLAISDNGKYLFSGGDDRKIVVWELPDFKKVKEWEAHDERVLSLDVSANNKYLVSTGGNRTVESSGNLKVWRLEDWSIAFEMEEETYAIEDASLSSGGTLVLYAGNFSDAYYYRWTDKKVATKVKATNFGINGVALNGTMAYLGSSYDGKLSQWNMKTKELKEVTGHGKDILGLAISSDGSKIATCGMNGKVILWKAD